MTFDLINNFARSFNSIILEALPFVVLGVVLAGILEEFVPQELVKNFFGDAKNPILSKGVLGVIQRLTRIRILAIAMGALLGLVFPMCECGIIAIMRRLIRKGLPLSVCISYTLCGPIINVVVLLSTFVAFNPPNPQDRLFVNLRVNSQEILGGPWSLVVLRAAMGFVVACVAALVAQGQYRKYGKALLHPSLIPHEGSEDANDTAAPIVQERRPLGQRLAAISEVALSDFVDIMCFLAIGAVLATFGRMYVDQPVVYEHLRDLLSSESPIIPSVSILLMMGLAILFCICSEADAFVVANFPGIWPPAAKLAFLVLGPMFDLKLMVMYTRIFRKRLIITVVLAVMVQIFVYSLAVHYLWPDHGYSESDVNRMGIATSKGN